MEEIVSASSSVVVGRALRHPIDGEGEVVFAAHVRVHAAGPIPIVLRGRSSGSVVSHVSHAVKTGADARKGVGRGRGGVLFPDADLQRRPKVDALARNSFAVHTFDHA